MRGNGSDWDRVLVAVAPCGGVKRTMRIAAFTPEHVEAARAEILAGGDRAVEMTWDEALALPQWSDPSIRPYDDMSVGAVARRYDEARERIRGNIAAGRISASMSGIDSYPAPWAELDMRNEYERSIVEHALSWDGTRHTFWRAAPEIHADGARDDTAAVQAMIDGKAVRGMGLRAMRTADREWRRR